MNGDEDVPIQALADLEAPVGRTFLGQFRRRVYRRTAGTQLVRFSWSLPGAILVEFLNLLGHLLTEIAGRKGKPS